MEVHSFHQQIDYAIISRAGSPGRPPRALAKQVHGILDMVETNIAHDGKTCTKCGEWKASSAFGKMSRSPHVKNRHCKECVKKRQQEWGHKNAVRNADGVVFPEFATCTRCNLSKPNSEFGRRKKNKSGLATLCLQCCRERDQKRYNADPARRLEQAKWGGMKWRFGITRAEYEIMVAAQDGMCAICGDMFFAKNVICVDHDHETKKVRGLLCKQCNFAVGLMKDKPENFDRAAAYLRSFE